MSSRILVSITSVLALMILVGGYVRLSAAHGDVSSFITFLGTVLIPGIAAYVAMIKSGQAKTKADEVGDKLDEVHDVAKQVESNTNGKMAKQFSDIKTIVLDVSRKLDEHLTDHNGGA